MSHFDLTIVFELSQICLTMTLHSSSPELSIVGKATSFYLRIVLLGSYFFLKVFLDLSYIDLTFIFSITVYCRREGTRFHLRIVLLKYYCLRVLLDQSYFPLLNNCLVLERHLGFILERSYFDLTRFVLQQKCVKNMSKL